jgi:hypothetical protein
MRVLQSMLRLLGVFPFHRFHRKTKQNPKTRLQPLLTFLQESPRSARRLPWRPMHTRHTREGGATSKCLHDRCVAKAEIQSPKIHKTQKCRTLTSYQPCDNTMPQALSTRSNTQAQYSSRNTDYIRQHDMFEHCTLSGPQHPNPSIRFLSPFATHPSASRESLTPRSSQALSSPRPHSDTKRMTHLTRQSRATAACTSRHDQH